MALCQGSSIWLAIAPGHSGVYGEDLEQVKKAGQWYSTIKPYLQNPKPIADVAVVLSGGDFKLPHENDFWKESNARQYSALDEVLLMVENLQTAGVFSNILYKDGHFTTWPDDLSRYKCIILPERVMMDSQHLLRIREYVNKGGQLLSFAHATCLNIKGEKQMDPSLADVFGIQFKQGFPLWAASSVQFNEEAKQIFNMDKLDINQQIRWCMTSTDVNVLCHYTLEQWMFGYETIPFMIKNNYGKGQSYYLSCSDTVFRYHAEFWEGVVKLVRGVPVFQIQSENTITRSKHPETGEKTVSRYLIILNQTDEGAVLHVIDRKGESSQVIFTLDQTILPKYETIKRVDYEKSVEYLQLKDRLKITTLCDPVATLLIN
jgi:hypothetical protein